METDNLSKPVKQSAREARIRREAAAAEFGEQLRSDLKLVAQPTATQSALLAAAVSAYVEVSELSAAFLRGNASSKQLTALGLARGQLVRTLRLLGLTGDSGEPEERDLSGGIADWKPGGEQAGAGGERVSEDDLDGK